VGPASHLVSFAPGSHRVNFAQEYEDGSESSSVLLKMLEVGPHSSCIYYSSPLYSGTARVCRTKSWGVLPYRLSVCETKSFGASSCRCCTGACRRTSARR
jgi:hypothetical protein